MTPWPKALIIAAWIGSVLSDALAAIFLVWSGGSYGWQIYLFIGWLVLACLLLLPPLWMKRSKTTAHVRIAAGFALLIGALFMPIQTHAVKLVMPSNSTSPR